MRDDPYIYGSNKEGRREITLKDKKDRYGAMSFGMAVVKPKEGDKYLFNKNIGQVYKKSISEAIANAVYSNFDFEEVELEGKQCVQIRLAIVPYDEYERLKRRAARSVKASKSAD